VDIFQVVRRDDEKTLLDALQINNINVINERKETLLHQAIVYNPSVSFVLIEHGINVNWQSNDGSTPLHYTAWHKQLDIAKKIIEKGGNLNLVDKQGNNPLWYAVFFAKGHYDLVRLLMKHGADPHNKNKAGRSALDFAKQVKDEELINILESK
jgi:ankyrin repeat protein